MAASAAVKAINAQEITDKARRDLLQLLEQVCKTAHNDTSHISSTNTSQVRGKKNVVFEKSLAGTIGLFVKFSTLQEYGVDKVFFLENHMVDASQRNIVFIVRGERARAVRMVAGEESTIDISLILSSLCSFSFTRKSHLAPIHGI